MTVHKACQGFKVIVQEVGAFEMSLFKSLADFSLRNTMVPMPGKNISTSMTTRAWQTPMR
jgi:hypothetical protein